MGKSQTLSQEKAGIMALLQLQGNEFSQKLNVHGNGLFSYTTSRKEGSPTDIVNSAL